MLKLFPNEDFLHVPMQNLQRSGVQPLGRLTPLTIMGVQLKDPLKPLLQYNNMLRRGLRGGPNLVPPYAERMKKFPVPLHADAAEFFIGHPRGSDLSALLFFFVVMNLPCTQFLSNLFSSNLFHPIHFVQSY